jgi:hypothetical protein
MLNGGTTLTYEDITARMLTGLETLIKTYIPYFIAVYKGHRPIGSEDVKFPCVMIEPNRAEEELYSTGKTEHRATFTIYFYIANNSRDGLVTRQSEAMNALLKLFSNNALGDLETATPTHKFKRWFTTGAEYWIDSEIRGPEYSPTFSFFLADKEQFCRAGRFVIELQDRLKR